MSAISIQRDGQIYGPYSLEDVRQFVADGTISPDDLAKVDGSVEFISVASLLQIRSDALVPKRNLRPYHWVIFALCIAGQMAIGIDSLIDPVDAKATFYAIQALLFRTLGVGFVAFSVGLLLRRTWGFIGSAVCWALILLSDLVFEGVGGQLESAFDVIFVAIFMGGPAAVLIWLRPVFVQREIQSGSHDDISIRALSIRVLSHSVHFLLKLMPGPGSLLVKVSVIGLVVVLAVVNLSHNHAKTAQKLTNSSSTSGIRNWTKIEDGVYIDSNSIHDASGRTKQYQKVLNLNPQLGRAASSLTTMEVNCDSLDAHFVESSTFTEAFGVGQIVGTLTPESLKRGVEEYEKANPDSVGRTIGPFTDPRELAERNERERSMHRTMCES